MLSSSTCSNRVTSSRRRSGIPIAQTIVSGVDHMKRPARLALAILVAAVLTPVLTDAQLFTLTRAQMVECTAQNPFERFPDGRPKVPDALIERARGMSSEE